MTIAIRMTSRPTAKRLSLTKRSAMARRRGTPLERWVAALDFAILEFTE